MFKMIKESREFEVELEKKSLRQIDLANQLEVGQSQISNLKLCKGRSPLGGVKLRQLCDILDIEFDEWFVKVKK